MRVLKVLIIGLIFSVLKVQAIEPVVLNCLAVDDVGNVTLSWTPINNVAEFSYYEIFVSPNFNGPYTMLQSINVINQDSYVHNGAGADFAKKYYFIKTVGTSSFSYSDTLETILLLLTNPGNGNANLLWNSPGAGYPPNSLTDWYEIQRKFPSGIMSTIDSTQSLNFTDTIALCAAQLSYRIVIEHVGCYSTSASKEDFFRDVIPPSIPILDTVSVSFTDDSVKIGWKPSISTDTEGYIVYKFTGGIWSVIDTVWGINNTLYSYLDPSVLTASQSYRIASLDSCKNASPLGNVHKTLLLQYQVNQCQSSANIQWNEYENIPSGNMEYLIYVKRDAGDYALEGSVIQNQQSFTISNLIDGVQYCFFVSVKANNGITASSPAVCFTYHKWAVPQSLFIRYADVNDDQYVDIGVYVDDTVDFTSMSFYKQNQNGTYTLLTTLPFNGTGFYEYTDINVFTDKETYVYKVKLTDICGFPSIESDTVKTILLTGKSFINYTNQLEWSPYYGFVGGIDSYEINRATGPDFSFQVSGNSAFDELLYVDDVFNLGQTGAKFQYTVSAVQGNNIYGFNDRSRSNKITLFQHANTFVPNAFTPGKNNPIFKPENNFVNPENYTFSIYTRWGAQIFTTHDPNEGWDGSYQGSPAEMGMYMYVVKYFTIEKVWYDKKGTVLLIR